MADIIKRTVKVGNSAGVILPRKLLGAEVRISVISRPLSIKKILFKYVPDFREVISIVITSKKPLEITVITSQLKDTLNAEKFKLNFIPILEFKKLLKLNAEFRTKIFKAEPYLNKSFLSSLRKEKL